MEKKQFQVGDVVRLKSGGPAMTVTGFEAKVPGFAGCVYFYDGVLRTEILNCDSLMAVELNEDNLRQEGKK